MESEVFVHKEITEMIVAVVGAYASAWMPPVVTARERYVSRIIDHLANAIVCT
jgi:hypothetical protein